MHHMRSITSAMFRSTYLLLFLTALLLSAGDTYYVQTAATIPATGYKARDQILHSPQTFPNHCKSFFQHQNDLYS